ncbi:Mitochondrial escape protein 2 [Mycena sanguinolenta]|uniref:Mitochondrial escape protein 2 n=1 Tax=Mycena sanguinolenta TaxID=230812 RepID=A0A8H6YI45_9AGAR|nr:Mitochondrial escape protein 2 [Mycena sanguinolenta]
MSSYSSSERPTLPPLHTLNLLPASYAQRRGSSPYDSYERPCQRLNVPQSSWSRRRVSTSSSSTSRTPSPTPSGCSSTSSTSSPASSSKKLTPHPVFIRGRRCDCRHPTPGHTTRPGHPPRPGSASYGSSTRASSPPAAPDCQGHPPASVPLLPPAAPPTRPACPPRKMTKRLSCMYHPRTPCTLFMYQIPPVLIPRTTCITLLTIPERGHCLVKISLWLIASNLILKSQKHYSPPSKVQVAVHYRTCRRHFRLYANSVILVSFSTMLRQLHRPLRRFPACPWQNRRRYSEEPSKIKKYLFVDAFPVRLGIWDLRHYLALMREEATLEAIRTRLSNIKAHSFTVVDVRAYHKDGGAFVAFEFSDAGDPENALETIKAEIAEEAKKHGGLPSWLDGVGAHFWVVQGQPWLEDMRRFPSTYMNVAFEGPDIREERLYEILRPYGQIHDIEAPTPVPAGSLRSAGVVFDGLRSATIARNTIHGLEVWAPGASSPTRLHVTYTFPLNAHKIRDWLTSHPRIVLPIVLFLLGSLTYTIFDPIRALMVQAKMQDWFDIREFRLYQWIRTKTMELRIFTPKAQVSTAEEVWKERRQAEADLRAYIDDWPSTIAFVHGPQGSGKSALLQNVLRETNRRALTIDCRALQNVTSDAQLMNVLAKETGYWPVFSFFNSFNHLIDLASVGLIGQKSSTPTEQIRDMLAVVRTALQSVNSSHQREANRQLRRQAQEEERERMNAVRSERIKNGTWHDGRLDCVAGNGVMAELGIGDELMEDDGNVVLRRVEHGEWEKREEQEVRKKQKGKAEMEAVESLPIVWAAGLAENQLAHVVVMSDNRENSKRLAKALPSKPLNTIALEDADAPSALAFVKRKLKDADINLEYSREQVAAVEKLGGRATDLESLIHKVRNGATVEDAVEDIIHREVSEVRKTAFGDDAEDAKNLHWSREQAWSLFKQLSKKSELPYHEVLLDFPFKGDEAPLRSMEHAELITIGTHNGRPSTIQPGKPVFQAVFERLVNDPIFQATQDIAFNEKVIAGAEIIVKACEQELLTLKEIGKESEALVGWKYSLLDAFEVPAVEDAGVDDEDRESRTGEILS